MLLISCQTGRGNSGGGAGSNTATKNQIAKADLINMVFRKFAPVKWTAIQSRTRKMWDRKNTSPCNARKTNAITRILVKGKPQSHPQVNALRTWIATEILAHAAVQMDMYTMNENTFVILCRTFYLLTLIDGISCTRDIGPYGHPSSCQCPPGYEYVKKTMYVGSYLTITQLQRVVIHLKEISIFEMYD